MNWGTVTKAKQDGGMGLRNMRDMNIAFLAKVGWRLIYQKNELWARVITAKYMRKEGDVHRFKEKHGSLNLWKGICKAKRILNDGIRKIVRSGKDTCFWTDIWIKDKPLVASALTGVTECQNKLFVADYWSPQAGWDYSALIGILPDDIIRELSYYALEETSEIRDDVYWTKESSGLFFVATAYDLAIGASPVKGVTDWELIWKIRVPSRMCMCMFMWLLKHEKVMCNTERQRRGLSMNTNCDKCG